VAKSKADNMPKPMGMDNDFQAECDLRCLIDAEKIRKDKGRLARAMKKHREMEEALHNVSGRKGKAA